MAGTSRSPLDKTVSYSATGDLPVIQLVRARVVLSTVVMKGEVMNGVEETARSDKFSYGWMRLAIHVDRVPSCGSRP